MNDQDFELLNDWEGKGAVFTSRSLAAAQNIGQEITPNLPKPPVCFRAVVTSSTVGIQTGPLETNPRPGPGRHWGKQTSLS